MNPDLQQAIEMTRSGDKVGAQKKVADILKEDPNNAHAWYLLSLLVDSDQKRAVYLSKVVALDPNHEKAVEQLNRLEQPPAEMIPVSAGNNVGFVDQEKADSIPAWMADAGAATMQAELSDTAVSTTEQHNKTDDVPDWVQEDVSASWIEEDNSVVTTPPSKVTKKAAPSAKSKPAKKKARKKPVSKQKKKAQQLNIALTAMIIFAIIIAIMLIYVLFS